MCPSPPIPRVSMTLYRVRSVGFQSLRSRFASPKEFFFGSLDLLWEQGWGSPVPTLSHIPARGSHCSYKPRWGHLETPEESLNGPWELGKDSKGHHTPVGAAGSPFLGWISHPGGCRVPSAPEFALNLPPSNCSHTAPASAPKQTAGDEGRALPLPAGF